MHISIELLLELLKHHKGKGTGSDIHAYRDSDSDLLNTFTNYELSQNVRVKK
jgi:hypothetical protein